jgi:hypothetical protein
MLCLSGTHVGAAHAVRGQHEMLGKRSELLCADEGGWLPRPSRRRQIVESRGSRKLRRPSLLPADRQWSDPPVLDDRLSTDARDHGQADLQIKAAFHYVSFLISDRLANSETRSAPRKEFAYVMNTRRGGSAAHPHRPAQPAIHVCLSFVSLSSLDPDPRKRR